MKIPPHHSLWKEGIYCDKCKKILLTNSKLKLWLWVFFHVAKCYKFIGGDYVSFLLFNPEHEIIRNGKVEWVYE